jgi:hypothetical protein
MELPVQTSLTSQSPTAGKQTVPIGANLQPIQHLAATSQSSPASTYPHTHIYVNHLLLIYNIEIDIDYFIVATHWRQRCRRLF